MNMVLAKESGKGGGIAASPALLAAFAKMLRSAASCEMPSSAACLYRVPFGDRSSVACTLSNMIVPVSHLCTVTICHRPCPAIESRFGHISFSNLIQTCCIKD